MANALCFPRTSLVLAIVAVACHRPAPLGARRPPPPVAIPRVFASAATSVHVTDTLEARPMLSPFVALADGVAAALSPDGHLHWTLSPSGRPVVHDAQTPCRFDASRHTPFWTLSPRLAVDGRGHVCCVNDGDATTPSGAYCGDLDEAPPALLRVAAPRDVVGVGSGAGAIAIFGSDLACTRDGGRHTAFTFRGDAEQPLSVASCNARCDAVAVTGTRAPGGVNQQTLRVARAGGALALMPDSPRGDTFGAFVMPDGSAFVLLAMHDAYRLVIRDATEHVRLVVLGQPLSHAIGAWSEDTALFVEGNVIHAIAADGTERRREIERNPDPRVGSVTRVGTTLVSVTREAAFVALSIE